MAWSQSSSFATSPRTAIPQKGGVGTLMTEKMVEMPLADIHRLATDACLTVGGSSAMTTALVDATLSAAQIGHASMGFPHFVDYLQSLRDGRIDGAAEPRIEHPLPATILSDARGGIAQLGFEIAFKDLVQRALSFGIAIFSQKNSYTAGELGYYVRRLASQGLVGLATANGPALMAASTESRAVFCTNPLAFGAPAAHVSPLIIDQAASATAFVNIVDAVSEARPIPGGWAVDETGQSTTDPAKALRGALLPFGGYKGANIALMVEVLSAGLSGAAWSLDADDFREGDRSPHAGLTVIAISTSTADPPFAARNAAHLSRLKEFGVHIPGVRSRAPPADRPGCIRVSTDILEQIKSFLPP
jgi:(2R)-3-sulfolactate dehydrogenase (NADP+)